MKNTFIVLLLLISEIGLGQTDTFFARPSRFDSLVIKLDTIPCIMLVCDTMYYTNYSPKLGSNNYFDKTGDLTWVIGYMCLNYSGVHYLDADKKLLSKNIVVWNLKEIDK